MYNLNVNINYKYIYLSSRSFFKWLVFMPGIGLGFCSKFKINPTFRIMILKLGFCGLNFRIKIKLCEIHARDWIAVFGIKILTLELWFLILRFKVKVWILNYDFRIEIFDVEIMFFKLRFSIFHTQQAQRKSYK